MVHARLPNDVESLKELVIAQRAALDAAHITLLSREVEIEKLKIELARLKRLRPRRRTVSLNVRAAQQLRRPTAAWRTPSSLVAA